ncbi:MAG: hypothetical protein EOO27_22265 [Comamonadaceae bacterium]|nr:MAG: hypothetical protein EOO27_22265 [Comamonadaceae bacterium]
MFWDKSSRIERVIIVWVLFLGSAALLFVLVSLSALFTENSSTVASWVQAIGSMAAIWLGFKLAAISHLNQKQLNDEHARRQKAIAEAEGLESLRLAKLNDYRIISRRTYVCETFLRAFLKELIKAAETKMLRALISTASRAFQSLQFDDQMAHDHLVLDGLVRTSMLLATTTDLLEYVETVGTKEPIDCLRIEKIIKDCQHDVKGIQEYAKERIESIATPEEIVQWTKDLARVRELITAVQGR